MKYLFYGMVALISGLLWFSLDSHFEGVQGEPLNDKFRHAVFFGAGMAILIAVGTAITRRRDRDEFQKPK